MTDTTTIEITDEQRERLRDVNAASAKAAVGDLLDGHEIDVPEDVREQLDRIESAAKEATNAAQNAEQAIEEATGQ